MAAAPRPLPLDALHRSLGARLAPLAGASVPRHYGAPAEEYAATREAAGVVDRSERTLLRLHGRDPLRMIQGVISNDLAGAPPGMGVYAVVLTPKGRIVADVRAFRRGTEVWLDGEGGAREPLAEQLRRVIPPLFARQDDLSESWGALGVFGPAARATVERALGALPTDMPENGVAERSASAGAGDVVVLRTREAGVDGYDLLAPADGLEPLWRALVAAGARPVGRGTLEVLRIEAGTPRWGAELTPDVIPLEAGLRRRAISETKGCYTGQEVIVRILHRGHVNRHLRGLRFADAPTPAAGTELLRPADGRSVGTVTSACVSPRFGETIGLGYVRREVEPPAELRLAGGGVVRVVALPVDAPEA